MKLYIVTDMEGCAGVVRESQLHGMEPQVREAGRTLAIETNAAVEAAFDAGAEQVFVNNGHVAPDEMQWDLLDARPEYVLGADLTQTLDRSFAGIGLVGQHAMAGSGGVLEHTYDMKNYHRLTLNGIEMGEAGFIAAVAGDAGVPVLFLSGDDVCCAEMTQLVPGTATAAVKQAYGRNSAVSLHPEESARRIAGAVKQGIEQAGSIKPYRIKGPVEMIIEYNWCAPVERNLLVPGIERTGPRAVRYACATATEAYRMFALLGRIV